MFIDDQGRTRENNDLLLSSVQIREVIDFLKSEYQLSCPNYSDTSATMIELGCGGWLGIELEGTIRPFIFHCIAGLNNLGILYDGKLASCSNIPRDFIEGDLRKERISGVWENRYQRFRSIGWKKVGPCKSCDQWRYCHGGPMHLRRTNGDMLQCLFHLLHKNLDENERQPSQALPGHSVF